MKSQQKPQQPVHKDAGARVFDGDDGRDVAPNGGFMGLSARLLGLVGALVDSLLRCYDSFSPGRCPPEPFLLSRPMGGRSQGIRPLSFVTELCRMCCQSAPTMCSLENDQPNVRKTQRVKTQRVKTSENFAEEKNVRRRHFRRFLRYHFYWILKYFWISSKSSRKIAFF